MEGLREYPVLRREKLYEISSPKVYGEYLANKKKKKKKKRRRLR